MHAQGKVKNIHWKPAHALSSVEAAAGPSAEGLSKDNMLKRSVA